MDLQIVVAAPKHAEIIASMYVRTARAAYRGILPDAHLAGLSIPERSEEIGRALAAMPPGCQMLMAYASQVAVAFCFVRPSLDEGASSETGEVDALYVEREYQMRGVGRRLLDHALGDLRATGLVVVTLWTTQLNKPAQQFYEHLGWRPDGATRSEMLAGEEVVEVRYRLPAPATR